ncbi:MAG TPA: endonuclease Q family protein [Syntrophomonadaceae bacterium]|nr:endonuclease Q family protein [Syntrophomonadaceae bacterium]
MRNLYGDLHIHIGSAGDRPVKITASRKLTLKQIIFHDAKQKGLDIVSIVDCASPLVMEELETMIGEGRLIEDPQGGLLADNGVLLILGVEVETSEGIHIITYLPDMANLKKYQKYLLSRISNLTLSTQRARASTVDLLNLSLLCEGVFCFAHAFTPHKGVYGMLTDRLAKILGPDLSQVKAIELGLSADTNMADMITETRNFNFLSNSDAHSGGNIGREYNLFRLAGKNFKEVKLALHNEEGRRIVANYGLDPLLGKYHRSFCLECQRIMGDSPPIFTCPHCGNEAKIVKGVYDRIVEIRDHEVAHHPIGRPAYNYRVPLKDLPGLGPKTLAKLAKHFTSEIEILERADIDDIAKVATPYIAGLIRHMRIGRLEIIPGGGGYYGKVKKDYSN